MKKIHFFSCIGFILLISSCRLKETEFKEIIINNQYSITLPDYLEATTGLHPKATFQYQNEEKDLYLVILKESREELAVFDMDFTEEEYLKNLLAQDFLNGLTNIKPCVPEKISINGNGAAICEMQCTINQTPAVYTLAVIRTEKSFYQVLLWVRQSNGERLGKDMDRILYSFKEV